MQTPICTALVNLAMGSARRTQPGTCFLLCCALAGLLFASVGFVAPGAELARGQRAFRVAGEHELGYRGTPGQLRGTIGQQEEAPATQSWQRVLAFGAALGLAVALLSAPMAVDAQIPESADKGAIVTTGGKKRKSTIRSKAKPAGDTSAPASSAPAPSGAPSAPAPEYQRPSASQTAISASPFDSLDRYFFKEALGGLGITWLSWNLVWWGGVVLGAGTILLPALLLPFLPAPVNAKDAGYEATVNKRNALN